MKCRWLILLLALYYSRLLAGDITINDLYNFCKSEQLFAQSNCFYYIKGYTDALFTYDEIININNQNIKNTNQFIFAYYNPQNLTYDQMMKLFVAWYKDNTKKFKSNEDKVKFGFNLIGTGFFGFILDQKWVTNETINLSTISNDQLIALAKSRGFEITNSSSDASYKPTLADLNEVDKKTDSDSILSRFWVWLKN